MDNVEAAFAAAIMRIAELVMPPQERRRPGRGWSGDARTEAKLQAATDAMHAAWQRLKMDTRYAQLWTAVREACNYNSTDSCVLISALFVRVASTLKLGISLLKCIQWFFSCVFKSEHAVLVCS